MRYGELTSLCFLVVKGSEWQSWYCLELFVFSRSPYKNWKGGREMRKSLSAYAGRLVPIACYCSQIVLYGTFGDHGRSLYWMHLKKKVCFARLSATAV